MHSRPSKHGIHIISSVSSTYGSGAHIRFILDFVAIFPDARHAVWNRHRGQATAARESTTADPRHAVWNRHRGQATAMIEFITYCVPICFD